MVAELYYLAHVLFANIFKGGNMEASFHEILDEYGILANESACSMIRVEKGAEPYVLKEFTSKDHVTQKIKQVRAQQSSYGISDLYHRHWIDKNNQVVDDDSINFANDQPSESILSVAQFNTLAEGLSAGPLHNPPFQKKPPHGIGQYGGFSSIPHPEITLDFNQRRWRLIEVIVGSDGSAPFDLIALQEVDRYYGFFSPILRLFGYDGVFQPKPKSPGVFLGFYSDGCCLFWKRDKFELLSSKSHTYRTGNQVYIIVTLKHKITQKILIVCVTHLKAKRENESVRQSQVHELLQHVHEEEQNQLNAVLNGSENISIFILGDFNADPPSTENPCRSVIQTILEYIPHETEGKARGATSYQSAYRIGHSCDLSLFTTWKLRRKEITKRIIDYIFFRGRVKCLAILNVPHEDEMEATKLPGLRYPSDHLLIGAKFKLM